MAKTCRKCDGIGRIYPDVALVVDWIPTCDACNGTGKRPEPCDVCGHGGNGHHKTCPIGGRDG